MKSDKIKNSDKVVMFGHIEDIGRLLFLHKHLRRKDLVSSNQIDTGRIVVVKKKEFVKWLENAEESKNDEDIVSIFCNRKDATKLLKADSNVWDSLVISDLVTKVKLIKKDVYLSWLYS